MHTVNLNGLISIRFVYVICLYILLWVMTLNSELNTCKRAYKWLIITCVKKNEIINNDVLFDEKERLIRHCVYYILCGNLSESSAILFILFFFFCIRSRRDWLIWVRLPEIDLWQQLRIWGTCNKNAMQYASSWMTQILKIYFKMLDRVWKYSYKMHTGWTKIDLWCM